MYKQKEDWGKHDAQCPLLFTEGIHSALKNSKFFIFNYSNHYPNLEEKDTDFKALS